VDVSGEVEKLFVFLDVDRSEWALENMAGFFVSRVEVFAVSGE